MSIRPTDLPVSPVHEGEVVRRVQAKPETRDRSRQPPRGGDEGDRQDAEAGSLADEDADADAGGDAGAAPAVIELSEEFRRDPAEADEGDAEARAGRADAAGPEPAGSERHLDIQA